MHIAFLRRHNQIADELRAIPGIFWTDELLFQEAKRIVVAELQHILSNEFLPRVLGPLVAIQAGLTPSTNLFDDQYSPFVDPRTTSGFSVAAYRFGHSLVRDIHNQIDSTGTVQPRDLDDHFDRPRTLLEGVPGGATTSYARWMLSDTKARADKVLVDGLHNNLFKCDPLLGPPCLVGGGATRAFDLAALNIQRGRDHGLPSYTAWRYACTGRRTFVFTNNFMGLSDHSQVAINDLMSIYK